MIEGFWIRNYKGLKHLRVGSCAEPATPLGPITIFTGIGGCGKSSVLDAFSFITDCFYVGVDYACSKRGGFYAIQNQETKGTLSIGVNYRQSGDADAATYAVNISCTKTRVPFIESELLAYRREANSFPIIFLQNGAKSIRHLAPGERLGTAELTKIEFTDYKHLGLTALERHPNYPVYESIRNLFGQWVLSGFSIESLWLIDASVPRRQQPLREQSFFGLVKHLVERYGESAQTLLDRVATLLPEVEAIHLDGTPESPKLLFKLRRLERAIPAQLLSEMTFRLFVYAVLLEEDQPAPLVAIEEPENGFDKRHREKLLELLRRVVDFPRSFQLFLTTNDSLLETAIPEATVCRLDKV